MGRYSVGARAAGAGSATLPIGSLYAPTGSGGRVREIHVCNTTATAVAVAVCRLTTTGTQGSALTEASHDPAGPPPLMTGFQTHSGAPTLADLGYRAVLGAAVGSAYIWTFGADGLVIPAGTSQGIGIYIATGTGQILDFTFVWDE